MEKCIRKFKGIGEIAVMEVTQVGRKTKARSIAMAAASAGSRKRRKVGNGESQLSSSYVKLRSRPRVAITREKRNSPATSENSRIMIPAYTCSSSSSDLDPTSRCSSNGSSELVKESIRYADLEEIGNFAYFNSRERSEIGAESDELESTARPSPANSRHRPAEKMPSEVEIEEFFNQAEKEEKKRFAEKYNYDIAKDVPLEGRYEWVRLKP